MILIKVTHPIREYQAGNVYSVPEEEALELIEMDFAFEIEDASENDAPEETEMTDGNWQNDD